LPGAPGFIRGPKAVLAADTPIAREIRAQYFIV
jgi:hypothetical protein